MHQYLAVTSKGLEHLLVEELKSIGVDDPKPVQAGVKFKATNALAYRCCLWSRLASRFVRILAEFSCHDDMDLYLAAGAVNWSQHFNPTVKLVVDFNGTNREIRNSQYGAMKVKDAIVDHFTKKRLTRPTISKDQADLRIHVRLHKDNALIGLDYVGQSLHARGYRTESGVAPLRETLAAAIVMRSGWDGQQPLLDPMCGSGTLLIEAAMISANIAPALKRSTWGFMALNDYDQAVWKEVKAEASVSARRNINKLDLKFYGIDKDTRVLNVARENAKRAGVDSLIEFSVGDATTLQRPAGFESGLVICNPPYGERLGTEPGLISLYTVFGAQLKAQFGGCDAAIFSSSDELLACLRMRADRQFVLYNGALQCHLKIYKIAVRAGDALQSVTQVAPDFANRLKKNVTKLAKWAKQEHLDCYRIYDADLPDYNAAIDVYGEYYVIQEYAAPKTIAPEKAKRRLTDMVRAVMQTMVVDADHVILKVREKQKGKSQYQKLARQSKTLQVNEYGVRLAVNLYDYLDTGLFLDHKLTRRMIGQMAKGKDFLNLFAYTGSATVHAAKGGAKSTTTVDMSKTYLEWARENMAINGCVGRQHQYVQDDCLQWLENATGHYDLIFIDPPTFSNSKRMNTTFDVQRDHVTLLTHLKRLIRPDGAIIFSNNKRHFKMDMDALTECGLVAENISKQTLPLDFARNQQIHNCWLVTPSHSS